MRHLARVGLGFFLLALMVGSIGKFAPAQEVTGGVVGTITDPSGAPITGAEVTVADTER